MSENQQYPEELYHVVVNGEEQYSIWPEGRDFPLGWSAVGKTGIKSDCLSHIEQVWTDMRPRSLREQMALISIDEVQAASDANTTPPRQSLVDKLCHGEHPIMLVGLKTMDRNGLAEQIKTGLVRVRFTETQGGTELSLRFDPHTVDIGGAETGRIKFAGDLSLDGVSARCLADIDIEVLQGSGRLEVI